RTISNPAIARPGSSPGRNASSRRPFQQAPSKLPSGMGRNMLKNGTNCMRLAAMLAAAMVATALPAANLSVAKESAATALSRHIRVLASSPRNFDALIGAGRAALELGDVQAAAGFFGRAEEAYPTAP